MKRNATSPDTPSSPLPPDFPSASAAEEAVLRVLAQPPALTVPADFAARVAQRATAQAAPRTAPWLGWGPRLALASGALLTAAMFALAPGTAPVLTDLRFDTELLLFAELAGLVLFSHRLLQRD